MVNADSDPFLILCVGGPLDGEQHPFRGDAWDEMPGGIYAIMRDKSTGAAWYLWYDEG